ncbi:MAG: hypothetical protein V4487_06720 [Chlamydiota bacterium]
MNEKMDLAFDLLKETPWWVFALFVSLVMIALRATQRRIITLKQLFIIPGILTLWNLFWLDARIHNQFSLIVYWAAGVIGGSLFGWWMVRSWKIEGEKQKKRIFLPPTWSTLILVLLIFSVRYFFGFNYLKHPESAAKLFLADSLSSGVITGIFIGRAVKIFQKYQKIKSD